MPLQRKSPHDASKGENRKMMILKALRRSHQSLSAYDILELIKAPGEKLAPTTIYRALDALISEGLVHRVSSKNAYVACQGGDHKHPPLISYCQICETVTETIDAALVHLIHNITQRQDFAIKDQVLEITGICGSCRESAARSS